MDQEPASSLPTDNAPVPTLLPSVFPNEPAVGFGGIEGHEGEKLHEMFLAGSHDIRAQRNISDEDIGIDYQDDQNEHAGEEDQIPDFDPFFTIVEDSATGEQHHPYVHYVFSDDEPDIMTNVLLHTLTNKNSTVSSESSGGRENQPTGEDVHERYIFLDIGTDGRTVVSARSLSPDWQVLGTQVTAAPTFNDSPGQGEAALMLRVEGREMPRHEDVIQARQLNKDTTEDELLSGMNRLVDQFHEEMDALKRLAVTDSGFDVTDEAED